MKKGLWIVFLLLFTIFGGGCAQNIPAAEEIFLEERPFAEDQIYEMSGGRLALEFTLPKAGCIKLLAYDATEYQEDMGEYPEGTLSFLDEKGEVLYDGISVAGGYMEQYPLEEKTVTALITFSGNVKKMNSVAVSWLYAPLEEAAPRLKLGEIAAAVADEKNTATFTFSAQEAGIYSISPSEGCVWESDCYFQVFDTKGASVAEELFIHGTEWIERKVFLPKGDYEILVKNIQGVAKISAQLSEGDEEIFLAGTAPLTIPCKIGFCLNQPGAGMATFHADGKEITLRANATGSDTYYDNEQAFTMVVRDSNGKEIARQEAELGSAEIEMSGCKGEYIVEITEVSNGVVSLTLEK